MSHVNTAGPVGMTRVSGSATPCTPASSAGPSLGAQVQKACVSTHFPISVENSTFQLEPADHRASEHTMHA